MLKQHGKKNFYLSMLSFQNFSDIHFEDNVQVIK